MLERTALLAMALTLPAVVHAGGNVEAGKRIFTSKCASCHSVGPSARGGFGPQLNGIVGRRAGTTQDYKYSAAMKSVGIAWSEANLRAFVQEPKEVVPGTSMRFWGMGDERKLDDLLAYLSTFK